MVHFIKFRCFREKSSCPRACIPGTGLSLLSFQQMKATRISRKNLSNIQIISDIYNYRIQYYTEMFKNVVKKLFLNG